MAIQKVSNLQRYLSDSVVDQTICLIRNKYTKENSNLHFMSQMQEEQKKQ